MTSPGTQPEHARGLVWQGSYPAIRAWLPCYGVRVVIPERRDQIARRAHRPGRRRACDRIAYRRPHGIENCVGWTKEARGVATYFETLSIHYRASSRSA